MEQQFQSVKVTIENGETRKIAFAKGINREVNFANVKKIHADMALKGYRKAEVIQVIKAEDIINDGDIILTEINGETITAKDANQYAVVVEGQHRVYAAAMLNQEREENGEEAIIVPAILAELSEGETISEYISSINITKAEWKTPDYIRGAANVSPNELVAKYNELIKTENNKDGIPLSTLNLIFCNNAKAITKSDLSLLCQGKSEKGTKTNKPIVPGYNIERGMKCINLCKNKGFQAQDIAKRYLIEKFSGYFNQGGEASAFRVFEAITANDCKAMHNDKGNLIEDKVIAQFTIIENRITE